MPFSLFKFLNCPQIYCDLDETLCNFFAAADNELLKNHLPIWKDPFWDKLQLKNNFNKDPRWLFVDNNPKFWEEIPWLPDGKELWNFIKPYSPHILSHATENSKYSYSGKKQWIKTNLKVKTYQIHLVENRRDKKHFAINSSRNSNVLIDDYPKNIDDWVSAGGIGILHISAAQTIMQLKEIGFR